MSAPGPLQGAGATYRGRFAPSPTGPLHAGSLVAALASWLDARAHGGQWLMRIEDVDTPRCVPGIDQTILQQLAACGLHPDERPEWQSQRNTHYQRALDQLIASELAYPCGCSRKDIEVALAAQGSGKPRHGELVYPGTCRNGLQGKPGRAWRFRTIPADFQSNGSLGLLDIAQAATKNIASISAPLHWIDRRLGPQSQDVAQAVGDLVLKRADGLWAYQLAVVVDDAAQGITHVVRGEDLADNTARQIALQRALGLPTPLYLHTPLALGPDGEKLSKQNGATALNTATAPAALQELQAAASLLDLPAATDANISVCLAQWTLAWRTRHASE
ncbi:MAG: tRNA glutamyl-Q(34) synthetase GluQRS [Curvibacter sp.]|nr:MAG: tRNA glutamyl-Q(34) synthetase GluQRS [Curvibacter sp.]